MAILGYTPQTRMVEPFRVDTRHAFNAHKTLTMCPHFHTRVSPSQKLVDKRDTRALLSVYGDARRSATNPENRK